MSSLTKQKREIVNTFVLIIKEYFDLIHKSNIMTELNYPSQFLYIGIHSIYRVFEHILMKTKNLNQSYFYAQKSYFYYLEYVEQLHKSHITINLNHIDIVMFVYKKTIFSDQSENTENMMSFIEKDVMQIENNDINDLCSRMIKIINVLMYWDNTKITFETRQQMFDNHLSYYLLHNETVDLTFLSIVQEKIKLSNIKYCEILKEIMDKNVAIKPAKKRTLSDDEKNEQVLLKFYNGERTFLDKYETCSIPDFVKWLYA